jgi:hypothetical protein
MSWQNAHIWTRRRERTSPGFRNFFKPYPQWPKHHPQGPPRQRSTVPPNTTTTTTSTENRAPHMWTFGGHYPYSNHSTHRGHGSKERLSELLPFSNHDSRSFQKGPCLNQSLVWILFLKL